MHDDNVQCDCPNCRKVAVHFRRGPRQVMHPHARLVVLLSEKDTPESDYLDTIYPVVALASYDIFRYTHEDLDAPQLPEDTAHADLVAAGWVFETVQSHSQPLICINGEIVEAIEYTVLVPRAATCTLVHCTWPKSNDDSEFVLHWKKLHDRVDYTATQLALIDDDEDLEDEEF